MAALVAAASVNIHDLVEADQVEVLEEALRPLVLLGVVQVGLASYDQPPAVHQLKPFDLINLTLRTVHFTLTNNFSVCLLVLPQLLIWIFVFSLYYIEFSI